MKIKVLGTLAVFFHLLVAAAQTPVIDPAYVDKVIKTLATDRMQGRKTFEPGAKMASDYIAGEFRRIGLKPLPGQKGYEQAFQVYRTKPGSAEVTLDGKPVDASQVLVVSSATSVQWTNSSPVEVVTVSATDNLQQKFGQVRKARKDALLLIDPAHASLFNRYRGYFSRGNISLENPNEPTYVLVLGTAPATPTFTVHATGATEKLNLNNVAGMLPGRSRPDEYVIFSGHYDHIGVLPSVQGDSIANGADDDASGTTAVIALADYYKKRKDNERTLIFVAFTAEEIGGYGSQYFSRQLKPEQVVAMFNIEMIGKESKFGKNAAFITGFDKSDFGKILQRNLAGTDFAFHPDPYPDQNLFYRSDNATLARLGVPAHTLSTVQIDKDNYYHTVDDEYETLDVQNIVRTIQAIALSARDIVAGKATPSRVDKASVE